MLTKSSISEYIFRKFVPVCQPKHITYKYMLTFSIKIKGFNSIRYKGGLSNIKNIIQLTIKNFNQIF